jgi:hypothetical protein
MCKGMWQPIFRIDACLATSRILLMTSRRNRRKESWLLDNNFECFFSTKDNNFECFFPPNMYHVFWLYFFFVLGMGHVIQGFVRLLPHPRQKVHEKGLA